MADGWFNTSLLNMSNGVIDMDSHTFKAALLADTYTPSAAHDTWSDVSAHEISGTGYTAGGQALTTVTWTQSGGTATFDCDNPSWTGATFTARWMIIYSDTAANDELLLGFDFGSNQSVTASTFTYNINASGAATVTPAALFSA